MMKVKFLERRGNIIMRECKLNQFSFSKTATDIRDEFEKALKQEEQDRIKYHDDNLNPIRA